MTESATSWVKDFANLEEGLTVAVELLELDGLFGHLEDGSEERLAAEELEVVRQDIREMVAEIMLPENFDPSHEELVARAKEALANH